MAAVEAVLHNQFRDSIQLMRLSEDVRKLDGVSDAVVAMGTETNRRLLQDLGLLGKESRRAGDGDLVIAVRTREEADPAEVMARVQRLVMSPPSGARSRRALVFHSVKTAVDHLGTANLAVVSVPGWQAFEPTMELLRNEVNVHLFSDHVPLDQEIKLKSYANSHGLLVLGPGAGTSIINGVGLGFANSVRKGNVGIVASAGTGIQEVSTMLDGIGLGVSAALGVGGTDVTEEVGGLMMKKCLALLEKDESTKTIMIVAKTPKEKVIREVMGHVERATTKPVIACFLGLDNHSVEVGRVSYAKTLHSAVSKAAAIAGGTAEEMFRARVGSNFGELSKSSKGISSGLDVSQRFVRGLFSGGTLAHETLLIFRELVGEAYSNTPLSDHFALSDPNLSRENSVVDLGDESFTAGRAHPMIDPTLRKLRIAQESRDPEVAEVMLDVVLGYGSAPDPGGALLGAIGDARESSRRRGGELAFVAHICGTDSDPQPLGEQSEKLSKAGVLLFPSNALMSAAAALAIGGSEASERLEKRWGELFG
jgi:FdrA protein